jgi:hypothetical protein
MRSSDAVFARKPYGSCLLWVWREYSYVDGVERVNGPLKTVAAQRGWL